MSLSSRNDPMEGVSRHIRRECPDMVEIVKITTEYIKLDQFLKFIGFAENGAEAKSAIMQGKVKVNGNREMQRGKKLRKGDTVEAGGKVFQVD
jgi:ribosome-associated protein